MSDRRIHWRCFHCGDTFTKAQERWARQHFGVDQDALPACQMRLPGEHHLLNILRKQEAELASYREEDTELWRALYAQSADHAQALRQEEERGYEKGVRDGRVDAMATAQTEAERYAAFYTPGSDGRNTFVIFADWCARKAAPEDGSQTSLASSGEGSKREARGRPDPNVVEKHGADHQ